jgi:outer membrane receptor protein involved in Fe transport
MNTGDSMMKLACRCLMIAALVATSGSAFAQTAQTGTIQGEVKDASGGVLPGVTMTLTGEQTGLSRTTITDDNGRYVFPAVPIGNYTIEAVLQGFKTERFTNNLVQVERTTIVPVTLEIGALTEAVQVIGDTPIVDPTTVAQTTRLSRDEFERLPVGRSYQALMGAAPGIVGTGNANSAGSISSSNLFVIDAVDTTDPTTGTFGTNINFESIQEMSVLTTAAGAEYGRAQGAIVSVVTKSGTNKYEGAAKYIFQNDNWDAQNTTTNEVTGASNARVKFDKVNPIYSFAGGGPIIKNRAFFFGTWELAKNTTPQRQTAGQIPEDFQQTTDSEFWNFRGTVQLAEGHTAWVKYHQSPTTGIVRNDYWGVTVTGDRAALTAQDQTNESFAAQWSGVLRPTWAMEAAYSSFKIHIDVTTFEKGILEGAPIFNLTDNKYYNGATFDGFVDRPRDQFNIASNWFLAVGQRGHNVKVGYDFQNLESGSQFDYPNRQFYIVDNYIQATKTPVFGPNSSRQDYDAGPSTSSGKIHALFARDKFELTDRISIEAGLRFEKQTGSSDVGASTVDTNAIAPRLSGTYDLSGDGKTLVTGSYGRYYASIIQGFSDAFAQVAQQANYNNYVWNGSAFVFSNRVQVSGSSFTPNLDLKPSYVDESTIGFQRQIGQTMAAGVRYIHRVWGDIIDDTRAFNPDLSINRQVVNYDPAQRKYNGVQFTAEKRFSDNWHAAANYTYSQTRGNHFENNFTSLGDYLAENCRTTVDLTIGTNGVVPCSEVQNGANKYGAPTYDRPHNFKLFGAYVRPIGPVNLSLGATTEAVSKFRYEKVRTLNVLRPGTTNVNAGPTATYFYDERGSDPVDGMEWAMDTAVETTWRIAGTNQVGLKAEIFNITNRQEKLRSNNTVWCGSTAGTGCQTAIDNFGKATARTSFRGGLAGTFPRAFRFTLLYRF